MSGKPAIRIKLWLEEDGRVLFGEGRLELLRALSEHGSLAAAARALNMSYRAAWGRLRASEERLGFALVEQEGGGRSPLVLTERAQRLMDWYQALEEAMEGPIRAWEATWDPKEGPKGTPRK